MKVSKKTKLAKLRLYWVKNELKSNSEKEMTENKKTILTKSNQCESNLYSSHFYSTIITTNNSDLTMKYILFLYTYIIDTIHFFFSHIYSRLKN